MPLVELTNAGIPQNSCPLRWYGIIIIPSVKHRFSHTYRVLFRPTVCKERSPFDFFRQTAMTPLQDP